MGQHRRRVGEDVGRQIADLDALEARAEVRELVLGGDRAFVDSRVAELRRIFGAEIIMIELVIVDERVEVKAPEVPPRQRRNDAEEDEQPLAQSLVRAKLLLGLGQRIPREQARTEDAEDVLDLDHPRVVELMPPQHARILAFALSSGT